MTTKQIKETTDEKLLQKFIDYVKQCERTPREFMSSMPSMLDRKDLAQKKLQELRLSKTN